MKLKTSFSNKTVDTMRAGSFFNKTMFMKNVTLYWPLWGLYTLILVIAQPIVLWLNSYYDGFMTAPPTGTERLRELIDRLYMEPYIWTIMIAAILFGMALFSYMYNSKSANMIHSLPVDRKELFGTNVISGLAFLIVPQIFTAILTLIVCAAYGIPKVYYVGIWLLMVMAVAIVFFSIVTICAMFTGLILALPFYVVVANGLSYWLYALVYCVISVYGFGVINFGYGSVSDISAVISFLSPFICILQGTLIDWSYRYENGYERDFTVDVNGAGILIVYVIVALILYFLAYKVYKKRQIEQAGDLLTVSWLKPFFRWGAGVTGGIFGGLLINEIIYEMGIRSNLVVFLIIMLILGGLCYFFAEMFVKKNFRVFKKKNWIGCGKFAISLLITFFALFGYAKYQEHYIPDVEDVEWAEVYMDYNIDFWDENTGKAVDIHAQILENLDVCKEYEHRWDVDFTSVLIRYSLKDGSYISRRYQIPVDREEMKVVIDKIIDLQSDPDIFVQSHFIPRYFVNPQFSDGYVEFVKVMSDTAADYAVQYFDMNETEIMKEFYEAALADAKAGTLIKYNLNGYYKEYYEKGYGYNDYCEPVDYYYSNAHLYISYYEEDVEGFRRSDSVFLNFGSDCENIINTLIKFGYIETVDDIIWE